MRGHLIKIGGGCETIVRNSRPNIFWDPVRAQGGPRLIDMADQHPPQIVKSKGLTSLKKAFRLRSPNSPLTPLPPAYLAPTVTIDPKETAKLRAKYTHFRILVIGRANAGKTTLLKRVCNSKEDPVYREVSLGFA